MVDGIESKIIVQLRTQAEQKTPHFSFDFISTIKYHQQQYCSFFNCHIGVDFQTVQTCIPKCIMALSISKIVRMNNLIY